jgi:cytochrome oxidase assembly protein ShyY1
MHVSYAVQWFLFAAILLGGSAALAWSRRSGGAADRSAGQDVHHAPARLT